MPEKINAAMPITRLKDYFAQSHRGTESTEGRILFLFSSVSFPLCLCASVEIVFLFFYCGLEKLSY